VGNWSSRESTPTITRVSSNTRGASRTPDPINSTAHCSGTGDRGPAEDSAGPRPRQHASRDSGVKHRRGIGRFSAGACLSPFHWAAVPAWPFPCSPAQKVASLHEYAAGRQAVDMAARFEPAVCKMAQAGSAVCRTRWTEPAVCTKVPVEPAVCKFLSLEQAVCTKASLEPAACT
jgi:hypothetical protein